MAMPSLTAVSPPTPRQARASPPPRGKKQRGGRMGGDEQMAVDRQVRKCGGQGRQGCVSIPSSMGQQLHVDAVDLALAPQRLGSPVSKWVPATPYPLSWRLGQPLAHNPTGVPFCFWPIYPSITVPDRHCPSLVVVVEDISIRPPASSRLRLVASRVSHEAVAP